MVEAVDTPVVVEYWATGYDDDGMTYVATLNSRGGPVIEAPAQVVLQGKLSQDDAIAGAYAECLGGGPVR